MDTRLGGVSVRVFVCNRAAFTAKIKIQTSTNRHPPQKQKHEVSLGGSVTTVPEVPLLFAWLKLQTRWKPSQQPKHC